MAADVREVAAETEAGLALGGKGAHRLVEEEVARERSLGRLGTQTRGGGLTFPCAHSEIRGRLTSTGQGRNLS
jgi:hypothetical protein